MLKTLHTLHLHKRRKVSIPYNLNEGETDASRSPFFICFNTVQP